MKLRITIILLFFIPMGIFSQQEITLEECYQLVTTNYPLYKKNALLKKQYGLDLEVANNEKMPKINFSAKATYQSDVIELPIPTLTPLNNDQYNATLSVNQLIYAGGVVDAKIALKSATLNSKKKQIEIQLYQLKNRVNQLYFSILLMQEKYSLLLTKQKLLNTKLKEVQSGIKNGILLPTSDKVIEVELLETEQQFLEIAMHKAALISSLSALIGKKITIHKTFQQPIIDRNISTLIKRPELDLFQLKKEEIKKTELLMSKKNLPKLVGFVNGGYGNPGLNMLDNSFQSYYMVGLQLNWTVFDWNTNKKKLKSLSINNEIIDNEKEIFELNTRMTLSKQQLDIKKLEGFILSDLKIIALRKDVLKSAESQLKNGVITASTYLTELTNLYRDQNNLSTHKIQLLLVKANYNITKGE